MFGSLAMGPTGAQATALVDRAQGRMLARMEVLGFALHGQAALIRFLQANQRGLFTVDWT